MVSTIPTSLSDWPSLRTARVLCGGSAAPEIVVTVAEVLKQIALAGVQAPNIITRDAVRGVYEWCVRHKLIDRQMYEELLPPYGSAPPEEPRTMEELMQQYDDKKGGGYTAYGTLLHSIFYTVVGDFGKYVIQPTLRHFSRHPLSSSRPQIGRRETYPEELGKRWVV